MIEAKHIAGVILAGGKSSRMRVTATDLQAVDKCLLDIAGSTMLARVQSRLSRQCGQVILNANGDPARFAEFGLPVVPDPTSGFAGPLAGILAGLNWIADNGDHHTHIATVAGDTPFFPTNFVAELANAVPNDHAIAIAMSDGHRQPVFGLWPANLREPLQEFLDLGETGKVMAFVGQHPSVDVPFEFNKIGGVDLDPFFNVNTPQDLAQAQQLAGTGK